jgi:hypothetical protein
MSRDFCLVADSSAHGGDGAPDSRAEEPVRTSARAAGAMRRTAAAI